MANCITCKADCISADEICVNTHCTFYVPKDYPKRRTNADRLNAMTMEEKASFLALIELRFSPKIDITAELDEGYDKWLDWLKQEVEDVS